VNILKGVVIFAYTPRRHIFQHQLSYSVYARDVWFCRVYTAFSTLRIPFERQGCAPILLKPEYCSLHRPRPVCSCIPSTPAYIPVVLAYPPSYILGGTDIGTFATARTKDIDTIARRKRGITHLICSLSLTVYKTKKKKTRL